MINIYTGNKKLKEYFKSNDLGVLIVENKSDSHYMITGRFTDSDYHEGLKGIIIPYTGHNRIDLDSMRKRNLKLYVTPTRSKYVAEKAITLMLSLLGNVINYHSSLTKGDWSNRNTEERVPWVSIQKKKIGFLGYGRIGRLTHDLLKGFNCDFYTINRYKEYEKINLVKNLDELINVSDIVIVSLPLNIETIGIINEDILKLMEGKYIINVGRGKLIDQKALYEALLNNTLKGYASDVWYNYPKGEENCFPSDYPIHELSNVVLSNHSGGFTVSTDEEVHKDLIKQIILLRDGDFSNALDLEKTI